MVREFILEVGGSKDSNAESDRLVSQGETWCRRRGSNPHDAKHHWILSPTRLPVPPLRRGNDYTGGDGNFSSDGFPKPNVQIDPNSGPTAFLQATSFSNCYNAGAGLNMSVNICTIRITTCVFAACVISGCFEIPHPPPLPADLSKARIAYGSDLLAKSPPTGYPKVGSISDLRYAQFSSAAKPELAIVGTFGAIFVGANQQVDRTTHFAAGAVDPIVLVQAKEGQPPFFLDGGSWTEKLRLFDDNGIQRWSFGSSFMTGIDHTAAGDLFGNGQLEFVVGSNGASGIYLLDSNGTKIWTKAAGNVWHVEIVDAGAGSLGRIINSDARGALTIRDPSGTVLRTFHPVQYVSSFGLTRWQHELQVRHLVVPDKDVLLIMDLNGEQAAHLEAPDCAESAENEIFSTPVCFAHTQCYQATLLNYKLWNRAVLYLNEMNGKLAYQEIYGQSCGAVSTIPRAAARNSENLLVGCGDEVIQYTGR